MVIVSKGRQVLRVPVKIKYSNRIGTYTLGDNNRDNDLCGYGFNRMFGGITGDATFVLKKLKKHGGYHDVFKFDCGHLNYKDADGDWLYAKAVVILRRMLGGRTMRQILDWAGEDVFEIILEY